jgi:hypothetical protein
MDPKDNLNKQRKKPEHKDFNINTITKARLSYKNNYLSKLALFTRKSTVHFSFILTTCVFLVIILWMMMNFEHIEKSVIRLVLLSFCIYGFFNTLGRQVWNMEKSKVMKELSPSSPKTYLHTFGTYVRWILPLAVLLLFAFIIIGFLKGY